MIVPVLLLHFSLAGLGAALVLPGLADWLLLAVPCLLASLILLIRATLTRRKKWLLIDGSNVMHWKGGRPDIATLREVVDHVSGRGFTPGVVFDANAGYKLNGRYLDDRALAKSLGLPSKRVMVVPRGTPADPVILSAARDVQARIVTNDRYRDWYDAYPEIQAAGHLVRGGYRTGKLRLDLAEHG
ncbi:hypothetical protein A3731_38950 [Roseovarius sp. HI0049]|nr:hypothetical protein A3731_06095 [Roseovarius sp. HI0049]KZY39231.1 hypothetical protein A3731_38950 [Roseovarius sp. HI0049]